MDQAIKKIIPCIDIKDGRAVKGVNFKGVKEVGDILELAKRYAEQGADELVLLDISATEEGRQLNREWIREVVEQVNIPLIVGGGISSVKEATELINLGIKQISIGSAAIRNPNFIDELVTQLGKEAVVIAIDGKKIDGKWMVMESAGTQNSGIEVLSWATEVQKRGAGRVLFTSMDHDGVQKGYPIALFKELKGVLNIPIIASGGAGSLEDFYAVIKEANVDAVLAASLFHYKKIRVDDLKFYLWRIGVSVNLESIFQNLSFDSQGLIPAIVQDEFTLQNLMLGYVSRESLSKTLSTRKVTFWSRSKKRLWTKGEESGNFLQLFSIRIDCDRDALLIRAIPQGATCHTGESTCWGEYKENSLFLNYLENTLRSRKNDSPETSYTASLYQKGTAKIAQKVGEEAVELVIEAMRDKNDLFLNEAADLMYHYIVLLINRGYGLNEVIEVLKGRHNLKK